MGKVSNGAQTYIQAGNFTLPIKERTLIMGVLNVTPDSFSDGGTYTDPHKATAYALQMEKAGADIIDIGGESTRPGAEPVTIQEELRRVIPVIEQTASQIRIPISIDTYKSEVAEAAVNAGASIVNDITSGRSDPAIWNLIREHTLPVVMMHMQGMPQTMQLNPVYNDIIADIISFFQERIHAAIESGVMQHQIILDPGIGFGKTVTHNFVILNRLHELLTLGYPLLVGPSRKSFIGRTLDVPADQRVEGTVAAVTAAVLKGAQIVRVHDVPQMVRAVRIADAIACPDMGV